MDSTFLSPYKPQRPGTIRFKCPADMCADYECQIYTLRLSEPNFGHWLSVAPENVQTQCNTHNACLVILSTRYDSSSKYPFWCSRPDNCSTEPAYPIRFEWQPVCKVSLVIRNLPTPIPPYEAHNIVLSIMMEFAEIFQIVGYVSICPLHLNLLCFLQSHLQM